MFKKFSLLRPILAILVFFIPLYPKFPLFNVTNTYVAVRLDDIVIAISLLFLLVNQVIKGFPVFKQKITWIFIAYFTAITLSTIYAVLVSQTDPTNILLLHLFRRFEYISLFFLTVSAIDYPTDFRFFYIFLFITTIGVSIYGYGQKYLHFPIISTMNSEFSKGQLLQMDIWSRVSSTFAGHYDLAAYLSVVLIIIGVVTILQKNIFVKIVSLTFWLGFYNLLNLTASRVSVFAYLGGMVIALILVRKYFWVIPVIILFGFSILNSPELNQRLLATIPALKTQISRLFPTPIPVVIPTTAPIVAVIPTTGVYQPNYPTPTTAPIIIRHPPTEEVIPIDADIGVARSGEIRFNVEWPRAINAYSKNPLTGTGLGSLTLATDNDYLRSLGESGLLGLITFLMIPIYFLIKTFPIIFKKKLNSTDHLLLIFLGCLFTVFANATLIDVFEASKTAYLFWIMMGFYYVTLQAKELEIKK
ncbi:O-antigen ligase family protein [Candidatus Shapirobacteria bacterium]|nr:O-antigen ligase family protein [Candidatus Shapirobacteria bacterium]